MSTLQPCPPIIHQEDPYGDSHKYSPTTFCTAIGHGLCRWDIITDRAACTCNNGYSGEHCEFYSFWDHFGKLTTFDADNNLKSVSVKIDLVFIITVSFVLLVIVAIVWKTRQSKKPPSFEPMRSGTTKSSFATLFGLPRIGRRRPTIQLRHGNYNGDMSRRRHTIGPRYRSSSNLPAIETVHAKTRLRSSSTPKNVSLSLDGIRQSHATRRSLLGNTLHSMERTIAPPPNDERCHLEMCAATDDQSISRSRKSRLTLTLEDIKETTNFNDQESTIELVACPMD